MPPLRNFLKAIITPLPVLAIFLFLSILAWFLNYSMIAIMFLGISLTWLILISTPWLPEALLASLENQFDYLKRPEIVFPESQDNTTNVHLLVIGAGDSNDARFSFVGQLHESSTYRLVEALRIHQAIQGSKLVFTGNSGGANITQAEHNALAAQELGVSKNDIEVIPQGWNTQSEALAYADNFGNTYPVILITDALHMPRAIKIYQKQGLVPIPAPVNFRLRKNNSKRPLSVYFPSAHYITYTELAIHAYLGFLWMHIGVD